MPVAVYWVRPAAAGRVGVAVLLSPSGFPSRPATRPPSAQANPLAGDALMGAGAHRRGRALLLTGAAVTVAGWSNASWPLASWMSSRISIGCGAGGTGAVGETLRSGLRSLLPR
jgi:hypothetical protein